MLSQLCSALLAAAFLATAASAGAAALRTAPFVLLTLLALAMGARLLAHVVALLPALLLLLVGHGALQSAPVPWGAPVKRRAIALCSRSRRAWRLR